MRLGLAKHRRGEIIPKNHSTTGYLNTPKWDIQKHPKIRLFSARIQMSCRSEFCQFLGHYSLLFRLKTEYRTKFGIQFSGFERIISKMV